MKPLRHSFSKNGLPYTLIMRNKKVALYGVGGTYTDQLLHYEVCQIQFFKEREVEGNHVEAAEGIPSNELFGTDKSRAIVDRIKSIEYYHWLTKYLRLSKGGKKKCYPFIINPILDVPIPKRTALKGEC